MIFEWLETFYAQTLFARFRNKDWICRVSTCRRLSPSIITTALALPITTKTDSWQEFIISTVQPYNIGLETERQGDKDKKKSSERHSFSLALPQHQTHRVHVRVLLLSGCVIEQPRLWDPGRLYYCHYMPFKRPPKPLSWVIYFPLAVKKGKATKWASSYLISSHDDCLRLLNPERRRRLIVMTDFNSNFPYYLCFKCFPIPMDDLMLSCSINVH